MIITKKTKSLEELLTLDDVRQYLRVDHSFDDNFIVDCLNASIAKLEKYTGNVFNITDVFITYRLAGIIDYDHVRRHLNYSDYPIGTINNMYRIKKTGEREALTTDQYTNDSDAKIIHWAEESLMLANTTYKHLLIDCKYGYEQDNLPEDLKLAILSIAGYFYENRGVDVDIPMSILNNVAHYTVR